MNKIILRQIAVLGIAIVIILCNGNTFALSAMRTEMGVRVKIEKEWKGQHCGYAEPSKSVIKTEDQWEEIWEKAHALRLPIPELPKIDFEKKMVVAVFMGECRSGGYEIEIIKISKTEKEIVVEVKEKEPPSGSLRTMALTQPYHIVVIESSPLSVRFQFP